MKEISETLDQCVFETLKYLLAYLLPTLAVIAFLSGGILSGLVILVAFVLIPVLESVLPVNEKNPGQDRQLNSSLKFWYDLLLYLNVVWVYGLIFLYGYVAETGDLSSAENVIFIVTLGVILGTNGINVAHELGHRSSPFEVFLSRLLLVPEFYTHFTIEHNRGHHKWVGTERDPATAPLNMNLYRFWYRSIVGSFRNAVKIEEARLNKSNKHFWSISNQLLQGMLLQIFYLIVLFLLFSPMVVVGIVVAGINGMLLLESINYIEHYGLVREEVSNGVYERVSHKHSWNSNHFIGRIVLYELTRHADHHHLASKKYQMLEHHQEAPQLALGYPGSIIMALIPFVWFRVMNSKLKAHQLQQEDH